MVTHLAAHDTDFAASAGFFDNSDFVEVVVHSYRPQHFTDLVDYRQMRGAHHVPQENPAEFAQAILALR